MSDNFPFALNSGDSLEVTGGVNFTNVTPAFKEMLQRHCPDLKVHIEAGMSCMIQQIPGAYGEIILKILAIPEKKSWTYDDLHSNPNYVDGEYKY